MQNFATFRFTAEQFTAIDQTLSDLERQLAGLISLTPGDKLRMAKLGDKADVFCRQTLEALAGQPQLLPPSLDVATAMQDMTARDQLRPLLMRIEILLQKGSDTRMALGNDAFTVASRGYGMLKLLGQANGLEPLRRELGGRFKPGPRVSPEEKKAA